MRVFCFEKIILSKKPILIFGNMIKVRSRNDG
jgi:hypothetical protein